VSLVDRIRGSRSRALRWTIVTSAPKGDAGEQWGDTWFARDLADALERAGQQVKVVSRAGANSPRRSEDDVVVVLRGLRAVEPPVDRSSVWMLWVISHPELVTEDEMRGYDAVFAASTSWQGPGDVDVTPLLQATAPGRFHPDAAPPDSGAPLLFVGSTRGEFRPSVRGALRSSRADELAVFGVGWEEFLPGDRIAGEFVSNNALPAAYAGAGIVLNDHHRDMAQAGFLSNRLFDAVASGARVLSDRAVGMEEVFGSSVVVFTDEDDLVRLLERPVDEVFPDRVERLAQARRVAQEHSFDARAAVLIDRAQQLRQQVGR
jgi:O-antigen biosynthesis protein